MKYMNVVLLHGFGETADVWHSFLPKLPTVGYEFLTLDYSRITFCQTIEEYADWLHNEMEQRNITRFVLIGHSMGGYIATEYARKYEKYLAGLCLFHSTSYADSQERKEVRDKTVRFLEKHGSAEFIADFLPRMYNDDFKKKNLVLIQKQLADNQQIPVAALITATQAMKTRNDNRNVLKTLEIPVAFVVGGEDKFIALEDALQQLHLPKKPYSLVLPNVAHAAMFEAPNVTAAFIDVFLENCE